jgi:GTP cyclohydrolase III
VNELAPGSTYAYFDGDDVGAHIELCLLEDDATGAALVSTRVNQAIAWLQSHLQQRFGASVIFAGGDEVLAQLQTRPTLTQLESVRTEFESQSSLSISCGLGTSLHEASLQLRLAKLRGKNQTQSVFDD